MGRRKDYLVWKYEGTTSLRVFLFLCTGVVLYASVGVPPLWMLVTLVVSFALIVASCLMLMSRLRRGDDVSGAIRLFAIVLPLFLIAFGGIWSIRPLPRTQERQVYTIHILTPQKAKDGHLSCDASITAVEGLAASQSRASLKVRLNTDTSVRLVVGQCMTARLKVYMPRNRGGKFNYPLYLWRNGYAGVAWMSSHAVSERTVTQKVMPFHAIRQRCMARFAAQGVSAENLPILAAITLGERSLLDDATEQNFRDAGVAHILVVSGMHVGFIFLLISLVYRRRKRWWVMTAGLVTLWLYALIVGMTPSVVRATVMFSIMLIVGVRQYNSLNALSMAAIVLLIANPMIIYDVGFQLSFLAVLSIMIFYSVIPDLHFRRPPKYLSTGRARRIIISQKLVTLLYDAARISIAAQLLVTPLLLYYFGRFPLYFLLTNIAVSLLTPFIFVGGIAILIPLVGRIAAWIVDWVITFDYAIVKWVAALPGAAMEVKVSFFVMLASIIAVLALGNMLRSRFSFRSVVLFLVSIPIVVILSFLF